MCICGKVFAVTIISVILLSSGFIGMSQFVFADNDNKQEKWRKTTLKDLGIIALMPIQESYSIIKPYISGITFDHKPNFCLFATDEIPMTEGIWSVLDWRNQLKLFTNNTDAWSIMITTNPSDSSECDVEIHFLKKPDSEKTLNLKPQGRVIFEEDRALIEVYTTQYYDETAHKLVKDKDNRLRAVPYEFADVPIDLLGKVIRHEMGHVFGLKHQKSDSIMVRGPVLSEIQENDLKEVVKKYGTDGW